MTIRQKNPSHYPKNKTDNTKNAQDLVFQEQICDHTAGDTKIHWYKDNAGNYCPHFTVV